ncbi:hypothetical protein BDC45DRAFT_503862 [Circinella umbellata]|nr:hypothetical protein BDC45DRAFT_503862 [Circinella umbellata]
MMPFWFHGGGGIVIANGDSIYGYQVFFPFFVIGGRGLFKLYIFVHYRVIVFFFFLQVKRK